MGVDDRRSAAVVRRRGVIAEHEGTASLERARWVSTCDHNSSRARGAIAPVRGLLLRCDAMRRIALSLSLLVIASSSLGCPRKPKQGAAPAPADAAPKPPTLRPIGDAGPGVRVLHRKVPERQAVSASPQPSAAAGLRVDRHRSELRGDGDAPARLTAPTYVPLLVDQGRRLLVARLGVDGERGAP